MNDQTTSFFQSKTFKGILYGIGIVIILLLTFQVGVMVGYHRALSFSRRPPGFAGSFLPPMRRDLMRELNNKDLMKENGALGEINKINGTTLMVKNPKDGTEKSISIKNDTVIERGFDILKAIDLRVGDHVIVIGSTNNSGQLEAKIIRILPNLASFQASPQGTILFYPQTSSAL